MHLGEALLQPANQIEVILESKIRVQPAYNVEFRCAFRHALPGAREDFLEREGISARRIRRASKRAQLAMRHADIRGIDVPVDVEVADVSVAFLAHVVGQPANRQQVVRPVECQTVFGRQASTGENVLGNWLEPRIADTKFGGHLLRSISVVRLTEKNITAKPRSYAGSPIRGGGRMPHPSD